MGFESSNKRFRPDQVKSPLQKMREMKAVQFTRAAAFGAALVALQAQGPQSIRAQPQFETIVQKGAESRPESVPVPRPGLQNTDVEIAEAPPRELKPINPYEFEKRPNGDVRANGEGIDDQDFRINPNYAAWRKSENVVDRRSEEKWFRSATILEKFMHFLREEQ
ncbi:hypothetical protein HY970_01985 [Candidatus Kaiserbacteria bacterium]|nr:hypothetical protein [Candidatus Kaiserbacteria bacterium]